MVITQIPVDVWHERIPDPTLADAILDRLVNNAYRLQLSGESQRRLRSTIAMSTIRFIIFKPVLLTCTAPNAVRCMCHSLLVDINRIHWTISSEYAYTRGLNKDVVQLGVMDGFPGLEKVFSEEFPNAKI